MVIRGLFGLVFSLIPLVFDASAQTPANASEAVKAPSVLTLPQAEQLLLQRNAALATSRYQLEATEALRQIAGYKPNPVVHLAMEQVPFRSDVPGSVPRFLGVNGNAGSVPTYTSAFTKLIERGGKREFRMEQADRVVEASKAQILDTFRTQLFQLRQAFTAALLAKENLRLAESIDAGYERTESLTDTRVKAGDLAGVERYRARAARLPYRQAVLDSRLAYEQATRDVLNLLDFRAAGMTAGAPGSAITHNSPTIVASFATNLPDLQGEWNTTSVVPSLADLRELALNERPDVTAARRSLEAAEKGILLARAQRSRDLAVGVEYQRAGGDDTLGVIAEFPLFLYNKGKAAIAESVAQQKAAETQLRQAETQAVTDVEKAYGAFVSAQRALAVYSDEGLTNTQRVRNITQFSYSRGEASLFELLDAQRTESQAMVAANQARAAYQLSLWQLEAATGRPLP